MWDSATVSCEGFEGRARLYRLRENLVLYQGTTSELAEKVAE
jgi:hypothetical protein